MMSRKHFKIIAKSIRQEVDFIQQHEGHCYNCLERQRNLADYLADEFTKLNSLFNRDLFMAACGF